MSDIGQPVLAVMDFHAYVYSEEGGSWVAEVARVSGMGNCLWVRGGFDSYLLAEDEAIRHLGCCMLDLDVMIDGAEDRVSIVSYQHAVYGRSTMLPDICVTMCMGISGAADPPSDRRLKHDIAFLRARLATWTPGHDAPWDISEHVRGMVEGALAASEAEVETRSPCLRGFALGCSDMLCAGECPAGIWAEKGDGS